MAHVPRNPTVKTRTERESEHGKAYVIVAGAPKHYIGGYGVVQAGDIVTLPEGVEAGKWLEEISQKDVEKLSKHPELAEELADAAGERKAESDAAEAEAAQKKSEAEAAAAEAAAKAK